MATNGTDSAVDNNEAIDEATAASDTLKPKGGSTAGDVGKTELLSQVVSMMGGMGQGEVNKFAQTITQYGKGKFPGSNSVGSKDKKGMAKQAMKEDVENLFSGQDDLSEEFKERASTLFEAAVSARVGIEMEAIREENEDIIQEAVDNKLEEIEENVDKFLSFVAEQWLEDNEIAIEESIKADAALNFLEIVREAMGENYIDVPEDRVDVVETLEARLEELEAALDEEITARIEMEQIVEEATKEAIFDDVTEGMVESQVERFRTMVEDIDFSDEDQYAEKLTIVKENYFDESDNKRKSSKTGIVTEETAPAGSEADLNEDLGEGGDTDPEVAGFVNHIKRHSHNTKYTG